MDWVQLVWFAGAFALVGSALAARRLPLGMMAKMALAWVAIFALAFVAVSAFQSWRGADPDRELPAPSDRTTIARSSLILSSLT